MYARLVLILTLLTACSSTPDPEPDDDGEAGHGEQGGGGEGGQDPTTTSSSGAGGEGGRGQGGEGGQAQVCTPGDAECDDLSVRVCNDAGSNWETTETCPFACSAGACVGECSPGLNQCGTDNQVETCDEEGLWQVTSTCPFVCSAGACAGACTPGSVQCTVTKEVETCDDSGQWVVTQTCPILCSNGSCTGSCIPGTQQCAGDTTQTCNAQGQWETSQICPFVCSAGACTGTCIPGAADCLGDVPRTCDAQAQWVSGSACPFVCSAGACVGVCEPGDVQCSGTGLQTCQTNGQWGTTSQCPDLPNSSPICAADACGFTCDAQFANCNSTPGCETQLGTTQNCQGCGDACGPAPANAIPVCTNQGCGFECLPGWDDCDNDVTNGCELSTVADEWNCGGCGIGCFGGSCEDGYCSLAPNSVAGVEKVAYASGVTSMTAKAPSTLFWTTPSKVERVEKTGGPKSTLTSGEHEARGITFGGATVAWSNTENNFKAIRTISVNGGAPSTLVNGHGPAELTSDGTDLFWTDQVAYAPCFCSTLGFTTIYRVSLLGGVASVVNTDSNSQAWQSWPGLAVTSTDIYRLQWWSNSASTVPYRQSKTNAIDHGPLTGGVSGMGQTSHGGKFLTVTSTGTLVYQATLNLSGSAIIKIPVNETSHLVALTPALMVKDLVADTSHAYVIGTLTGESWDRVLRYSMTDPNEAPLYLANFQHQAANLEIDDTRIFWTLNGVKKGNGAPVTGTPTIVKLTK